MLQRGLDFGDDYDEPQDEGTGEFGEDIFGEEYSSFDNISRPWLESTSGIETPESHLPTLQGHVETFTGAGISPHCLIDRQGYR
jgi:hypothetical protein